VTRDLLADNVEAYIAGDRRRALAAGTPMPDRVTGTAIFADISGFTPLTEALAEELGPQRGAEELTIVLNSVFDAVLGELHNYGGSVIYFSGDAVTCWLDGDAGLIGVACGLAMQEAMHRVEDIVTPGGAMVKLGMKVAVAAGPARRFVVGDPDIQLIDVLAGSLMDRLAAAEHHAEKGEVVVDAPTLEALEGSLALALVRGHGAERVGVVGALAVDAPIVPATAAYPRLPRAVVRQWLLPPVWERMRSGRGDFLSELRPAVPMFVRFGGIDYDNDADAHLLLDHFLRRAQQVIDGYGGNVLQLTIGDKGAYLHAVFGAPLAHEDDAARACAAALDVLDLEAGTAVTGLQIGVVYGRLRSGAYGHWHRRAFSCLGDAVNLAARLMSAAPPGQIYVGAPVAQSAGDSFVFEELADIQVKGKVAPVAVRRLTGRRQDGSHRQRRQAHPLVGRQAELGALVQLGERARSGQGQVTAVVAEAGMGKSRLVEEALQRLGELGMPTYAGAAASVGSATSYLAWQSVWRALLGVNSDGPLVPQLERALADVGPSLLPRLPLLGAVMGTPIEDNDLTRSFDAKLRKTSLESLLLSYLTAWAQDRPTVLVLEDCHWLDPLSADLLEVLARAIAALPVLIVLTYRPGNFAAPRLRHTTVIELDKLDPDSCRQLVTARLEELYGPEMAPPVALLHRLADRAEGNAFYLEELVNYLHAEGADLADPAVAASVELPVSLATLVLSRIDTLAERPRRTLKVASVVGREFGVDMLTGAYPDLGAKRQVTGHLRRLCAYDLVVHEEGPVDDYAFKHAVVREVAYDSLPFALRGRLHGRIGTWLETSDPDALDLLAHHFGLSPDEAKKREYLLRAGDAAQGRYANDAAVEYFRRAVALLDDEARGPVLLKLGAVLELKGDWGEAEAVFGQAAELAQARGDAVAVATARAARADPVRKQGRFDEAVTELELAAAVFEVEGNDAGLGRVWHLRGTIAAQRGNYAEAREQYERSRRIRVALGDGPGEASLLSNLAIVAEYEEDYDRAQELNEQAFALRSRLGDRWGIGVSRNNAGMVAYLRGDYLAARALLEEARRLELEVGDLWMVAIANHNLGNATRELGETAEARSHYAEALSTYGMTGDRWAQCLLFEDVAMLAIADDPRAALRLLGAAEAMREAIGSPRVAALEAELEKKLRPVHSALSDDAAREHAAGQSLDGDAALHLATQLCTRGSVAP
jgi:class 3 adenylate cyclase/tetratricopeptide (TPR) repeat protein